MRLFTCLLFITGLAAQDYPMGPDSQIQSGVPHGVVTKATLPPGKYYPGTPHNYAIYVPAQYNAAKPAPVMIFMDGLGAIGTGQRVPIVFDNLIAKKEIPPMIGIFVDPGVLPTTNNQAQNRFERVFEYDSLSDRFSKFLLEELLPAVAKQYNLSTDPNDRALAGGSTGAVAAFAAAWNRPDRFRRVASFIGTFVAMKGADGLPALIRRTEPKPLRIYLEAGKQDHLTEAQPFGTFYAGSWPINNQVMFDALQFAGYDVKLDFGEQGHAQNHRAAIFPDVMRWLWRGYPAPITVHEPAYMSAKGYDPRGRVYSTITASMPWQPATGVVLTPASVTTAKGGVYAIDSSRKSVTFQEPRGKSRVVYSGNDMVLPSALALSPDQSMLVVADAQSRLSWSFQIGSDGALSNGEPFYRLEISEQGSVTGATGVTLDSIGQVYFATPLGIQVCEANGRVAMILNPPEYGPVTAVSLIGNDLFATVNGKLFRRPSKMSGNSPTAPAKPPKPPL